MKRAIRLTAAQIRAARALLNWSRDTLALKCGVSLRTIVMIEADEANPRDATMDRIVASFTKAGVKFIKQNGGGPGVRFTRVSHP